MCGKSCVDSMLKTLCPHSNFGQSKYMTSDIDKKEGLFRKYNETWIFSRLGWFKISKVKWEQRTVYSRSLKRLETMLRSSSDTTEVYCVSKLKTEWKQQLLSPPNFTRFTKITILFALLTVKPFNQTRHQWNIKNQNHPLPWFHSYPGLSSPQIIKMGKINNHYLFSPFLHNWRKCWCRLIYVCWKLLAWWRENKWTIYQISGQRSRRIIGFTQSDQQLGSSSWTEFEQAGEERKRCSLTLLCFSWVLFLLATERSNEIPEWSDEIPLRWNPVHTLCIAEKSVISRRLKVLKVLQWGLRCKEK